MSVDRAAVRDRQPNAVCVGTRPHVRPKGRCMLKQAYGVYVEMNTCQQAGEAP